MLANITMCVLLMMCCKSEQYLPGNPASRLENIINIKNVTLDLSDKIYVVKQEISNEELKEISEVLLTNDINNVGKHVIINYQGQQTQSTVDAAPLPLLSVKNDVWRIPTIAAMLPLYDNYIQDTRQPEDVTPQEKLEENRFLDAIMSTPVMTLLMEFLCKKGFVTSNKLNQRDFINTIWFELYPRSKSKLTSTGFEHVFLSEIKRNKISGLHNWIYFHNQEMANNLNYNGYLRKVDLGGNIGILKMSFTLRSILKPVSSMFISTSPELEMALYTLCFVARPNKSCKLRLANKTIKIISFTLEYNGKKFIGSAYPLI